MNYNIHGRNLEPRLITFLSYLKIEVIRSIKSWMLWLLILTVTVASAFACSISTCSFEDQLTAEYCNEYARSQGCRNKVEGGYITYGVVEKDGNCICQYFSVVDLSKLFARVATLETRVERLEHPNLHRFDD